MSYRWRIELDFALGIVGVVAYGNIHSLDLRWYWDVPLSLVCWLMILQFIDVGRLRERREMQQAVGKYFDGDKGEVKP